MDNNEMLSTLFPEEVPFVRVEDCCTLEKGATPIQKAIPGEYPLVVTTSERKSANSYQFEKPTVCIPLISSRGHGVACLSQIYYQEGRFALGNILCGVTPIDQSQLSAKFLFYYLNQKKDVLIVPLMRGGANVSLTVDSLRGIKVPIPPIKVQEKVVNFLDVFEELEDNLRLEISARNKQFEYYRKEVLTFNDTVKTVPLETIADIGTGSSNTNEGKEEGLYPFFVRSQEPLRKNEYEFDETAIITAGDGVGVGKVFHFVEGKYALHQRAYRIHITSPDILPKYYFHYMKAAFLPYIEKTMYQGSVASIRRPMLNAFPVPVPPVMVQKRIISILDQFETICSNPAIGLPAEIDARQKQYDYYRYRLLSFNER